MPPPTPDARPARRRLSEDERREQILEATIAVVGARAYDGASLARIAAAAGVSKGLVSHYFAEKDDLMEAAARRASARVRDDVAARLDLTAPVPEVIRQAVRHAAQLATERRTELAAVREIVTNLRRADGRPRLDLTAYAETHALQERLLRRGQEEGSLRDFDVRVMAVTYQGAIDTMLGYLAAYPETDADRYAEALVDLLLAAVGRR